MTPPRYRPGIGLRPGGERPDLEALVPNFYAALDECIAAHSRLGLNVVADVGHHDSYSAPLHVLPDCARRLSGLPVLFVGVHCPLEIIMERRSASRSEHYVTGSLDNPPLPVQRWQKEVHIPGIYDLELDTSRLSPETCAAEISRMLENPPHPSAFHRLANLL